jgi:D-alanine transaminase
VPEIAFVNGRFMALERAVVPVEDRGFQFADGVYEVVATYQGEPYALEPHLKRLERSLGELRLDFDVRAYGLERIVREGIRRSQFDEVLVYVQITRGVAPRHHEFPKEKVAPTVVLTFKSLRRPAAEQYEKGVRAISLPDRRWKRCDIKSIALLANVLAKQQAAEAGAHEALLVDERGRVTEGSSTSAFCVRAGELWTAPEGPHILPSITRGLLIGLARNMEIPVREEFCTLQEYKEADEVFLAGTTTEAIGVVQIDQTTIGQGRPGPITQRLRGAFLAQVKKF